jgi:mono/diheme cytochrome c family protein
MRLLLPGVAFYALSLSAQTDYARDVEPVLTKRCTACHGAGQQMAGLRLDDPAAVLKGGNSGAVVVAGKSDDSKLIQRVTSTKKGFAMPPAGAPLTPAEVAAIRAWIDAGAKVPEAKAGTGQVRSSHWAFQPLTRPAVPAVRRSEWVRNPIDAFILSRLEANSIEPSPEASKTTLVRRLSLDLTGLPPAPADVAAFVNDDRPDAYERLVTKYLDSPHYGEKWARYWLDLARYADSDGYEKDLARPWAWRYRQWVINALNADMPFDEFTLEQLAGDLLPNASVEQRVATGFHRNVLINREAGVDRAEARFEQMVNRTNTIGTVWLGLTVGCAQCHNHKYDPISQKEYYQLFSFVNTLEDVDIDAPLAGESGPYMRARPPYDRERQAILTEYKVLDTQREWEEKMREAIAKPGADIQWDFMVTQIKAMVDNAAKLITTPEEKRTARQQERLTKYFLGSLGPALRENKERTAQLQEAKKKLDALDASLTPLTQAQTVVEDADAGKTYIARGGDYRSKGDEVSRGVLAALSGKPDAIRDRIALAKWLTSPENPLTARVVVNRMWQELFGRGLVRTSEDFGTQGEKPSHPELLDWLAAEFQSRGWSMKQMHRLIVSSAAYRQSSKIRKELLVRDPDNTLAARQSRNRLPAEMIRDSALAAGGLLNTAVGGKSIRPPQPAGVAELVYGNNGKWKESEGPERYRRGLYIHFQRTAPYPQLMTFDAPDSNVACTRRTRSNTPLQALNLLNDPVFFEAAQGLATQVLSKARASTGERLDSAFELALARKPNPREKERLSQLFDQQIGNLRQDAKAVEKLLPLKPEGVDPVEAAAWVAVSRVILNLDEFITKE